MSSGPVETDEPDRRRAVVIAGIVALSTVAVVAPAPATAQSDTVTLTVSVIEDRTGNAVGGVTVVASWDGNTVRRTTAGNGKAFVDVPAGQKVTLDVEDSDYVRNFPYNVTRSSDGEVTLDVAQRAELTVVTEDTEGAVVSNATVTLVKNSRVIARGRTDAEGRYRSGAIERGEYTVRVSKPGYYDRVLTANPGGSITQRVTVESGTVGYEFRVRDDHFDSPRPVSNATVQVGEFATLQTLDDGRTTVGIPVNTVQSVRVSKPGYQPTARRISVGESGGQVTLFVQRSRTLSLRTDARRVVVGERITVQVRNEYDEPAADVAVLRNGTVVGRTDADGTLAVPVEARGPIELRARAGPVTSDPQVVEGVVPAGTATPTPTPTAEPSPATDDDSDALAPGFGPGAALIALVLVAAAGCRRRQSRR